MERNLVKLQGFNIDTFTFDEALQYAEKGQVVTINPEMILSAKSNPDFAEIINSAELVVADGIGVEIGLKILGYKVKRIAGIDLGKALVEKFTASGKSVAMIGAKPRVVDSAIENLSKEYKNLNVVYSHDGYFDNDEDIIESVISANPDLILVALGSPKQEFFIHNIKEKLPNSTLIGLGGSFDVWAGVVERAPEIYQRLGLEWLYRTVMQPERFKRIFPTLPLFVLRVLKERLLGK